MNVLAYKLDADDRIAEVVEDLAGNGAGDRQGQVI